MANADKLFNTYMELLSETGPAHNVFMKEIKHLLLKKFKKENLPLSQKVGKDELLSSEIIIVVTLLLDTIRDNLQLDIIYNELLNDLLSHELEE